MVDDSSDNVVRRLRHFRQAGAIAQGLILGFLVVLASMELASLAGDLSPFKYQGY